MCHRDPRIRFLRGRPDLPSARDPAVKHAGLFRLYIRALSGVAEYPGMAVFTGRMARISCIAMGGEVWFERHESIVVGRYFRRHDAGAGSSGGRSRGILQETGARFSSSAGFGQVFWQAVHLQIFLGARTT